MLTDAAPLPLLDRLADRLPAWLMAPAAHGADIVVRLLGELVERRLTHAPGPIVRDADRPAVVERRVLLAIRALGGELDTDERVVAAIRGQIRQSQALPGILDPRVTDSDERALLCLLRTTLEYELDKWYGVPLLGAEG